MNDFCLNFESPVIGMQFHCNGISIDAVETEVEVIESLNVKETVEISSQLADSIKRQLEMIEAKLGAIMPEVKSVSARFVENFIAMLAESDQEFAKQQIMSKLNVALTDLPLDQVTQIKVNPDLIDAVQEMMQEAKIDGISVSADPLLPVSDCRIEGPELQLIARLQRHLETVLNKLLSGNDVPVDA
jgi:flagellar biosynthesis/type III secretory pathway protein FliH